MTTTNLPNTTKNNTTESVKSFFYKSNAHPVSFPAGEIDATIAFFTKRDFDQVGAGSIAVVMLNQARQENVDVFTLLDTLKSLTDVQLSQVVAQVLNSSRDKTSLLGYRTAPVANTFEARNILI
jgi:hypothetical protein